MSGSNILGDDPWGNGWADDDNNAARASPFASTYLDSSQVLTSTHDDYGSESEFKFDERKIPESYKSIYNQLNDQMKSGNDFERLVLDQLVQNHKFLGFQRTKIINTIYDHSLSDVNQSSKFYQCLGLVALELDVEGTGDYVTLQFKVNDLPDIPPDVVQLLIGTKKVAKEEPKPTFVDPLTSQMANSGISGDSEWDERQANPSPMTPDPLLTDHSSIENQKTKSAPAPAAFSELDKYINEYRDQFKPLYDGNETINVKEVPEKEGLVFKHINYAITHQINLGMNSPAGPKKVIRRYSDFVWLLEFLLKKYPFRVIPGLPPKKFTGASPDSQFLQRRRRGLHRFLNQLVRHPVIRKEPIVVTFLSVPTDLTSWRKQAQIDYNLEFKGVKISPHFMNSIWSALGEEFLTYWKDAETNISKLIDVWTKIVILVERFERRQQQIAYDNNRFSEMISKFQDMSGTLYPHSDNKSSVIAMNNRDDFNSINTSLNSVTEFFTGSNQIIIDDTFAINTSVLEKFKNYLDYLYSLVELFERSKRLSINTITQLQNKIKENETKFNRLSSEDADIKGSDLAKLKQTIINDKQEMFQQLNKDWLIKECCLQEYLMFQETQYLLSELWIEWSKGRTKFENKLSGLYNNMDDVISTDMPTSR